MNIFIYEAILGTEYELDNVCFPIRTEKTLDHLVLLLNEKAEKYIQLMMANNIKIHEDETFFPFENEMEFDLHACLDMSVQKNIFKLEDWKKEFTV